MAAIPHSFKVRHDEQHEEPARATREPGAGGEVARVLAGSSAPKRRRPRKRPPPPVRQPDRNRKAPRLPPRR